MNIARPHTALCPTLDSEVLVVLVRTTRPLTGREVARLVERSEPGVRRTLQRLVTHGLVDSAEAGRALLYTLNREHVAFPVIDAMASLWPEFVRRLRQAVNDWEIEAVHVSLFGSAARSDGGTASDIDLFVVRPDDVDDADDRWRHQVDGLATSIRRWTGNHAAIAEVSRRELRRLRREQPPIVADLRADAVELLGKPVSALVGPAR